MTRTCPAFKRCNERKEQSRAVWSNQPSPLHEGAAQNTEICLEILKLELLFTLPLLCAFRATTFDNVFRYEHSLLFQWDEIPVVVGRQGPVEGDICDSQVFFPQPLCQYFRHKRKAQDFLGKFFYYIGPSTKDMKRFAEILVRRKKARKFQSDHQAQCKINHLNVTQMLFPQ